MYHSLEKLSISSPLRNIFPSFNIHSQNPYYKILQQLYCLSAHMLEAFLDAGHLIVVV